MTSAAPVGRAISSGRRSTSAFQSERATSYPRAWGSRSSPRNVSRSADPRVVVTPPTIRRLGRTAKFETWTEAFRKMDLHSPHEGVPPVLPDLSCCGDPRDAVDTGDRPQPRPRLRDV